MLSHIPFQKRSSFAIFFQLINEAEKRLAFDLYQGIYRSLNTGLGGERADLGVRLLHFAIASQNLHRSNCNSVS